MAWRLEEGHDRSGPKLGRRAKMTWAAQKFQRKNETGFKWDLGQTSNLGCKTDFEFKSKGFKYFQTKF
jgi:hypothetical protein